MRVNPVLKINYKKLDELIGFKNITQHGA